MSAVQVARDYKKAVEWYLKAAEQDLAEAQLNLGVMYVLGQGVIEDNIEAYKWFLLAGMNGHDVFKAKEMLKEEMTVEQIEEGRNRARKYAEEKEKQKIKESKSKQEFIEKIKTDK